MTNMLIESGKAFYFGISQCLLQQIMEAIAVCTYDYIYTIIEQPKYSMLVRNTVENQLVQLHDNYGIGINKFVPLAGGLLTASSIVVILLI